MAKKAAEYNSRFLITLSGSDNYLKWDYPLRCRALRCVNWVVGGWVTEWVSG